MPRPRSGVPAAALLVLLAACGPRPPGAAATQEGITAGAQRFMEAVRAMDAGALAGLYTEDGILLPPNAEPRTGRIAIRDYWQAALSSGVVGATLETREIIPLDTFALERGDYRLEGLGGSDLDRGKYLVLWKLEGGAWLIHRDIWNTSAPAVRDTVIVR